MPTRTPMIAAVAEEFFAVAGSAPRDLLDLLDAGLAQGRFDAEAQIEVAAAVRGAGAEQLPELRRQVV